MHIQCECLSEWSSFKSTSVYLFNNGVSILSENARFRGDEVNDAAAINKASRTHLRIEEFRRRKTRVPGPQSTRNSLACFLHGWNEVGLRRGLAPALGLFRLVQNRLAERFDEELSSRQRGRRNKFPGSRLRSERLVRHYKVYFLFV